MASHCSWNRRYKWDPWRCLEPLLSCNLGFLLSQWEDLHIPRMHPCVPPTQSLPLPPGHTSLPLSFLPPSPLLVFLGWIMTSLMGKLSLTSLNRLFFQINLFIYLLIYLWLYWVFVVACGLSLVVASGGYSSLWCAGFSLWWLLLLQSMGSRHGLQ